MHIEKFFGSRIPHLRWQCIFGFAKRHSPFQGVWPRIHGSMLLFWRFSVSLFSLFFRSRPGHVDTLSLKKRQQSLVVFFPKYSTTTHSSY